MVAGTQNGRQQKSLALAVSLGLHGAAFFAFLQAPSIELPRASESEYKQAIEGREQKIVWYKFRRELPAVRPNRAKSDKRPLRAETIAKQAIVSAPRRAPKREQMVWTPAPAVAAPRPVNLPNLLAIRLPAQTFTAPPAPPAPSSANPQLAAEAPVLTPQPALTAQVQPPLPSRPFRPPAIPQRAVTEVAAFAEAPQLAANLTPGAVSLPDRKLPPRPFTAPSAGPVSPPRGITVETPPPMEANSKDLNVAVVGLNPVDRLGPPPTASSPAAFSSGPKIHPGGASAEGAGKALTVPDLFVRGPREPAGPKPDLLAQAYAAPTSRENLRAALRGGEQVMTARVPDEPPVAPANATKVSGAPDPRFNGRDVFLMAIQMPNLTSYSGSWLMWYADHTAREAGLAPIVAPVPHRKVDPAYVATAVEERVEGTITLGCVIDTEGKVKGVELVRGLDSRLNATAQAALAKWEFYPALRNGLPVAVDVLVQIPFRLAPKPPRR